MPERKRGDARGRFRVGDLGELRSLFKGLGINEGDIITVTEGFPTEQEALAADGRCGEKARGVTHEKRQGRSLHTGVAWYVGELYEKGDLEPIEEADDAS